jgi:hypothetical protein
LKNFNQFRVSDGLLDGKSGYHDDWLAGKLNYIL